MDVQCERCNTRYEFDDALVSARGTKVRCTQCGHQFRLQPSSATSDRWHVLRETLPAVEFASLRELHQAIRQGQVTRRDRLVRDGRERVLGEIAELATFFAIASSPPPRQVPTIPPTPPAARVSSAVPPAVVAVAQPRPKVPTIPPPPAVGTSRAATVPPSPSAAPKIAATQVRTPSVPPPVVHKPLVPMRTIGIGTPLAPNVAPPAVPRELIQRVDDVAAQTPMNSTPAPNVEFDHQHRFSSPMPPPAHPSLYTDRPSAIDDLGGSRPRMGGWVIAGVLLLGAGVVGALALRAHTAATEIETPVASPPAEAEVIEKLLRSGRLEEARAKVDATQSPNAQAITTLRARVLTAIADEQWLIGRLDPSRKSDDFARQAGQATLKAFAMAPQDPDVVRARIDALRILGELTAARALVEKAPLRDNDTAYSLAALDIAQGGALPPSVVDRLTAAATGESELGRARALLVSVLISLGRPADARNELDRLSTIRAKHPAIDLLRRALDSKDAGPMAKADASPVDASQVAAFDGSAVVEGSSREASHAMAKRDFGQARSIYEALVAKNPGDPEALTGLGNVKRATGDASGAIGDYKRALAANGSYLPAMISLGDTYWASGQQGEAMRIYREIVDRFPESAYPAHIAKRVKGTTALPAEAGGAPATSVKTPDEPIAPAEPEPKATTAPPAVPPAPPPKPPPPPPDPEQP